MYLCFANALFAKGIQAGTVIQNSATLSFSIEGEMYNIASNISKSVVAQVIDTTVSWEDTKDVVVGAGEKKCVLTYRVRNEGNGEDRFNLLSEVETYKSDFTPSRTRVYLDTNNNFRFDSSDRERKTVTLDADQAQFVFVVSDMKSDDTNSRSKSYINLKAVSRTGGSGIRGKIHSHRGVKSVDAVDGLSGGLSEDEGVYKLLIANVKITKDVTQDDEGLITVSLDITVVGEGSVKDVHIVDKIPDETLYVKGSLLLDSGQMTDSDDSDAGRYKRKYKDNKAEIQMSLGDLDITSHHTITYNLTIR